jgi:hypothetical protein
MDEPTFDVPLTEGEIIIIREALRKFPRSHEMATPYDAEIMSADRKMTEFLAASFDQQMGLKK